jgi:hypothetical protein
VIIFENAQLEKLSDGYAMDVEGIYTKTVVEKLIYFRDVSQPGWLF